MRNILRRIPLGPVFIVGIVLMNGMHLLIHGTPLDGGAMDAFFAQANMFMTANVNTDAAFFWRR